MPLHLSGLLPFLTALRLKKALARQEALPSPEGAARVARLLMKGGRGDEALSFIKESRRRFPGKAVVNEAYLSIRTNQARAALRRARSLLSSDPQLDNFLRVADLERTLGKFRTAFRRLQVANRLYPDYWGIHLILGKLHLGRFRAHRARNDAVACLQHLRHANALNPDCYQVLIQLALATYQLGLHDETSQALATILASIPSDPRALALRAHLERARARSLGHEGAEEREYEEAPRAAAPAHAAEPAAQTAPNETVGELESLQGVVGTFAFEDDGRLAFQSVRSTPAFEFEDAADPVKSMVAESRLNASSMGVGELRSCFLAGPGWQVFIRSVDALHVVLFREGDMADGSLATDAEKTLQKVVAS